ncbi:MAG: tRNA lysidine(34) synthetase TilS [Leptolinea sp.]|jgi:tRNA(Ile)-lysidine synthase|nr:tRNA lysidine(34) synthetase TilS [Leptolinea sp.]
MKPADFKVICEESCLLDRSSPILVGFSGGADSLALLLLLQQAGYQVIAAHFNHHLRDEAWRDEDNARDLAAHLNIPFVSGEVDVLAIVREQKLSVEEAARQTRYRWLLQQAQSSHARAVAVAHTADDQVETVLMHLLRGSGLDGLTGMSSRQFFPLWNSHTPVVRPLLTIWRKDTESICAEAGLQPVMDASNASPRYFRNRIRMDLIPCLQEYNPQAKSHILQTTQILAEDQSILNIIKEQAWQEALQDRSDLWITLKLEKLAAQPEGLRRYILRRGLLELSPGIRDIDFALTRRLSDFVFHPSLSGEMHLIGKLWVQKTAGQIVLWNGKPGLMERYPQIEPDQSGWLGISDILEFNGWRLSVSPGDVAAARDVIRNGGSHDRIWLDADLLEFPLMVRPPHNGERISPLGMKGKTQKLSDYFVNRKISRQARAKWPLVISGMSIVWVSGVGISESAAITDQTRRVIQISLQRLTPPPDDSTCS